MRIYYFVDLCKTSVAPWSSVFVGGQITNEFLLHKTTICTALHSVRPLIQEDTSISVRRDITARLMLHCHVTPGRYIR